MLAGGQNLRSVGSRHFFNFSDSSTFFIFVLVSKAKNHPPLYFYHQKVFGHVEMDASIMEGSSMQAGAVASVGGIRHPVQLARFFFLSQKQLFAIFCWRDKLSCSAGKFLFR